MKCTICNEIEMIKINQPNKVKFQCKKGHTWYEDYVDMGGSHQRPDSYEVKLEDILFPEEKIIYQKIMDELEKNVEFYTDSSPKKKAESLIKNCNISKEELYQLFKKIVFFKDNKDNELP